MNKFETVKRFRDRGGKELGKLTVKQVNDLKVYEVGKVYESDNTKWTDYLVKEGFVKSNKKTSIVKKEEEKPKHVTSKKSGE